MNLDMHDVMVGGTMEKEAIDGAITATEITVCLIGGACYSTRCWTT